MISLSIIALGALGTAVSAESSITPSIKNSAVTLSYTYTSLGCFPDSSTSRDLQAISFFNLNGTFTPTSCFDFCASSNYEYAGYEYGRECYCDFMIHNGAAPEGSYNNCNMTCTGEPDVYCGGPNHIQIFQDPLFLPPVAVPATEGYTLLGCYTDSVSDRTLTARPSISQSITVENCVAACNSAGYAYAGVEYANECYCDNSIGGEGVLTEIDTCSMQCKGNSKELCGGSDRILIYHALL